MNDGPRTVDDAPRRFPKGSGGNCIVQALTERGIPYRYLRPEQITNPQVANRIIVEFHINGKTYYFGGGALRGCYPRGIWVPGPVIDGPKTRFLKKKDVVKSFLQKQGLNVPRGSVFRHDAQHEAESFFTAFAPTLTQGACVKPADGGWGSLVHLEIRDIDSFRNAFAAVCERYPRVLVEETIQGSVYRFNVLAGRVVAVEFQRPANVEGDGTHTIAELVNMKNAERQVHPTHGNPLQLGVSQRAFLEQAGFRPEDIPKTGERVFLSPLSNLHQGGEHSDATDDVHKSYAELIEHALKQLPQLVLGGVDTIIQDASKPATGDNYYVLEMNRCPGFSTSHYPWRGQPRDVAGAIVDYLVASTPTRPKPRRLGARIRQALWGSWSRGTPDVLGQVRRTIRSKDIYEAFRLSGQGLLAWTLPEAAWQPLARLFGRLDAAMKPGRTRRHTARIAAALHLPKDEARRIAIETRVNGYLERFQLLRAWRFDGWSPAVNVLGEQHVANAQARGTGIIFWTGNFSFNDIVSKMALHQIGVPVGHFSRPLHGFSGTPFGIKYLNAVKRGIEDRYLGERIMVRERHTRRALNYIRKCLQENKAVSFKVGHQGRRRARADFLGTQITLATAPLHLAQSTGATLLPVFTLRTGLKRYEVTIGAPIVVPKDANGELDYPAAIRTYADMLAPYVRRDPAQWRGWRAETSVGLTPRDD